MKSNELSEKIFDLLESKSFDQLTENEKELVLRTISKDEYGELRNCIGDFLEADQAIEDPKLQRTGPAKSSIGLLEIAKYPIPLYKVAAGFLLLIGIFSILPEYQSEGNADLTVVRDTIQRGIPLGAEKYPDSLIFNP